MNGTVQNEIFSRLKLSKSQVLTEMAFLSANQKLAEFKSEVVCFEQKYGKTFKSFDKSFKKKSANFNLESDWLAWRFADESRRYWQNLVNKIRK